MGEKLSIIRPTLVEVLQFKATAWPKVASESTYEAQKF